MPESTLSSTPFEATVGIMRFEQRRSVQKDETNFEAAIASDRPVAQFLYFLHKANLVAQGASPRLLYVFPAATVADRVTAPFYYDLYQRLTSATSGEQSETPATLSQHPRPVSRAVSAAEDLIRWLDITYDELKRLTGISRSAFFYWKREGADPRPSTVRRLLRVHSIVGLAVRQFGVDGGRAWLASGAPSAWELFTQGDVTAVERRAQGLFFRGAGLSPSGFGSIGRDTEELALSGPKSTDPPRQAQRRPKRGRPSTS
jgi:hypothetical protein